jgi:hypothetical protein
MGVVSKTDGDDDVDDDDTDVGGVDFRLMVID